MSHPRARVEPCGSPAVRQLKRSPNVFKHLQAEDSASRGSEQRKWMRSNLQNMLPPVDDIPRHFLEHHVRIGAQIGSLSNRGR